MLEQLKYKNHVNEVFEFGRDGIYVNIGGLHNYEWSATRKGNRISSLSRKAGTRKLPVVIFCASEAEGIAARNRLMEVAEKDVLAMQPGKIIIGDYYFPCFVTKSEKDDYLNSKRYMKVNLTLTSDLGYWVKETTTNYFPSDGGTGGLDYSCDYPVDFASSTSATQIINTSFVATNFRLIIYGPVTNPAVTISGHTYQVNCTVEENQYLTIDSNTKKIFLTAQDGTVTNKFNDRSRDSYIFEKIPAGINALTWAGEFCFDVVLLEERSEPKWT